MNHLSSIGERKRDEIEEERERFYSNWNNLPKNFTSSLLYFLSPLSNCTFKATCKSWNEAKLFLPVPAGSPTSPSHSSPLLIFLRKSTYEFLHPMNNESFHVSIINDHHCWKDARVLCSNYGWLLMSHSHFDSMRKSFLFFFNPFTKQRITLPPVYTKFTGMCFTSAPTSPNCLVFGWASSRNETALLRVSEKNWRIYDFELQNGIHDEQDDYYPEFHCPVFHRGLCYLLDYKERISVCHLHNNCSFTFHDTNLSKIMNLGLAVRDSFLLEVDGKLLGIFESRDEGIVVLWLDVERWEWYPVRPNDLKDKILYLSNKGSFVQCDDTTKGIGNRVCICVNVRNSRSWIYYSLDTKKYHSMDGTVCYEQGEMVTADWVTNLNWITPAVSET